MSNIESNLEMPNINDILEEKVQINSIFHFSFFQNFLEEFIKRQNIMYNKLNSLELKFNSQSLDIGGDTESSNKMESIKEFKEGINQNETEKNNTDDVNENGDIAQKVKKLNKKVKILEISMREMAQKSIIINNDYTENNENVENNEITSDFNNNADSDEKINQLHTNLKNLEKKLKEKERVIKNQENKMNQLIKKIELIELNTTENKKTIKEINTELFNLQRLKLEDLVNEFYKFKNQNDKENKDLKNLIDEKIIEFKNNLLGNNNQDSNNQEDKKTISTLSEIQMREMGNELKNYVSKNISETNKTLKNMIEDLNIEKINQDIKDIQNELKEKLTQKNLTALNIRLEDIESKIIDFNSQMIEFKHSFDHLNEHSGKVDKNIEFLSMNLNRIAQNEPPLRKDNSNENIKKNNQVNQDFIKKEVYEEDMTKILKKLEKIFVFQQDSLTKLDNYEKKLKFFATDKDIKNIEHYTLNMVQEFKVNAVKKFMDKKEGNKSMKLLGLQIKNINEFLNINNASKSNISSDRILVNNIQNNNFCPSCESKISNQGIGYNREYISSRSQDKNESQNYRMGQGFSHLLKLINCDLMRSAEKINNDLNIKIDDNAKSNNEILNGSALENKSLPRLNSQKSFWLLNAEVKSSELDSSNINNISGLYYESNLKNLKQNTIDKLMTKKPDIKNKIFRNIQKNLSWREGKNQSVVTKLKK